MRQPPEVARGIQELEMVLMGMLAIEPDCAWAFNLGTQSLHWLVTLQKESA
jgi:hypothetical protein